MQRCTWPYTLALRARLFVAIGGFVCGTSFAQICHQVYLPVCGQLAGEPAVRTFSNHCTLQVAKATLISPGECPAAPMPRPGSDMDIHGCKSSAGYRWHDELAECVRPWMSSVVTLEVAPERRKCRGMVDMQCLMVQEWTQEGEPHPAPPAWRPLFAGIVGFEHQPGKQYTLRVRKDKIQNPPADAPDTRYTLLKVLR
jgi:hypothetical protein